MLTISLGKEFTLSISEVFRWSRFQNRFQDSFAILSICLQDSMIVLYQSTEIYRKNISIRTRKWGFVEDNQRQWVTVKSKYSIMDNENWQVAGKLGLFLTEDRWVASRMGSTGLRSVKQPNVFYWLSIDLRESGKTGDFRQKQTRKGSVNCSNSSQDSFRSCSRTKQTRQFTNIQTFEIYLLSELL